MRNEFKDRIGAGERRIGLWLGLADPYTAEICAGAGFDWLLIDGEHAPNDVRSILAQLQAVAAHPAEAVVRPVSQDPALVKQLLDIGARSFLFPMVDTAEQARAIVRATRYPPEGIRGVGSALARASAWNRRPGYLEEANQEICVLVQIETPQAVENIREIIAVEGVDGAFVGLSDLSATMGYRGLPGHAVVQKAFEQVAAASARLNKPVGTLAASHDLAVRAFDMGCAFVAVGTDIGLLVRGCADLVARFAPDPILNAPLDQADVY